MSLDSLGYNSLASRYQSGTPTPATLARSTGWAPDSAGAPDARCPEARSAPDQHEAWLRPARWPSSSSTHQGPPPKADAWFSRILRSSPESVAHEGMASVQDAPLREPREPRAGRDPAGQVARRNGWHGGSAACLARPFFHLGAPLPPGQRHLGVPSGATKGFDSLHVPKPSRPRSTRCVGGTTGVDR